jgi:competence protein ComEC
VPARRDAGRLRGLPAVAVLGPGVALAMLVGALLALSQAALPSLALLAALAILALAIWIGLPRWRLPAALLAGFALTAAHGSLALQARLPHAFEGRDLVVSGRVGGLPQSAPGHARLDFVVEAGEGEAAELKGRRLRLGWYGQAAVPAPGSRWQLTVRLKRPRGAINPGGFDFERHALERRLAATGYVREDPRNRELAPGGGIHALRQRVSEAIAAGVGMPRGRFVQALAVGDTRALDERDWEVLRATGIAHLIAISGLHVGLVAGFGALLVAGFYRLLPRAGLHLPLPQGAALAAMLAAGAYTALAGFALPTVRTLLMIGAALLAVLLRRRIDTWQSFALALLAVLFVDPLSLLGAGFWLSFLGVAWLLWCLPRENRQGPARLLLDAQAVMSLSLLPLTVWFFGQASVVGPLANLVAVPWISFVVVPVALAGTAFALVSPMLGAPFFVAAAALMQGLWFGLERIADLRGAFVYLPPPDPAVFALALLGAFWLLLPRAVPGKALALLLFVPLLWPRQAIPAHGEAELWLFDVGQGLSLLVRTREHALLYDAGPAYAGGLDMGEAAVLPALRALGVSRLDRYIESHGDNDHAGGSDAVLRAFDPPQVYASDPRRADARRCVGGERWSWDGVEFALLHPPPHFPYLGNDSSCVLSIRVAGAAVLVPGDISELIEARLQRDHAADLRAEVLVVPHHGSRTSSSAGFIAAVDPQVGLIGVGHRNRFGLPREDVLARYVAADVALHDTAAGGALRLRLGPDGPGPVQHWREVQPRFWRER